MKRAGPLVVMPKEYDHHRTEGEPVDLNYPGVHHFPPEPPALLFSE